MNYEAMAGPPKDKPRLQRQLRTGANRKPKSRQSIATRPRCQAREVR